MNELGKCLLLVFSSLLGIAAIIIVWEKLIGWCIDAFERWYYNLNTKE